MPTKTSPTEDYTASKIGELLATPGVTQVKMRHNGYLVEVIGAEPKRKNVAIDYMGRDEEPHTTHKPLDEQLKVQFTYEVSQDQLDAEAKEKLEASLENWKKDVVRRAINAKDRIEANRRELAEWIVKNGIDGGRVSSAAKLEAELDCWASIGNDLADHPDEVVEVFTHTMRYVMGRVLQGPDDGWSGRGNDAKRAAYDGLLEFVKGYEASAFKHFVKEGLIDAGF